MDKIRELLNELRCRRSPRLAKELGDLMLYESLLAGLADRVARGQTIDRGVVPSPDKESAEAIVALRARAPGLLTDEESELLEYAELLEAIRRALQGLPAS